MKKNYQKPTMRVFKMNTHRFLMASGDEPKGRSSSKFMDFEGDAGDGYGD